MKYTLIIQNIPFNKNASAYFFAEALLNKGHQINCIFFYHEAIFTASKNIDFPVDDKPICAYWQNLANKYNLKLLICKNAALRRGLLEKDLLLHFSFATLGQLFEACSKSDRVLTFK